MMNVHPGNTSSIGVVLCDPVAILGMDLMAHALSFVGGGHGKYKANIVPRFVRRASETPTKLWRLDQATRFVTSIHHLGLVSKAWRDVVAARLSSILGPIDGTFYMLANHRQVHKRMRWIVKNKLRMGSVLIYSGIGIDLNLVLELLQTCDTTDLERLALHVEPSAKQQANLYNIIAHKCPSVKELAIPLQHDIDLNHALFQMSSIQWMHIQLSRSDLPCYTNLPVSKLPALNELRLSGGVITNDCPMKVASDSLEILNLEGLNSHVFVQCDCPRLKSFSCNTRSGSFPKNKPHDRHRSFAPNTAGQAPFWRLRVPPSCQITVDGYVSDWYTSDMESVTKSLQARFPD